MPIDSVTNRSKSSAQRAIAESDGATKEKVRSSANTSSVVQTKPSIPEPPRLSISAPNSPVDATNRVAASVAPLITPKTNPREKFSADKALASFARRKRKRFVTGLVALVVLAGVCVAAALIAPRLIEWNRDQTAARNSPESNSITSQSANGGQSHKDEPAISVDSEPVSPEADDKLQNPNHDAKQPEPPIKIEWPEGRSISRRDFEKFWDRNHAYAMKLVVQRQGSTRVVHGLLIDPRGWVVTSLAGIQGAKSVSVSPAPRDVLDDGASSISDDVRGVLAVDRVHDLVLLQINRRLVDVVTAVEPTDQLLVPGRTLIQVAPPGKERFPWATECRITDQRPREKLSTEINRRIERLQLDLSPYWPAHDRPLETAPGGALYTTDGKLAGMNTCLADETEVFFVEATKLLELMNAAREPATELSTLVPQFGNASTPSGQASVFDPSDGKPPFLAEHQAYADANLLYESFIACEDFDWSPQTSEQQQQLTQALVAFRGAITIIRNRGLRREDRAAFQKQVDFWRDRLQQTLCAANLESRIEQNKSALEAVAGSQSDVTLFAAVEQQAGLSPRVADLDTVTLRLTGTDQFVIVNIDGQNAAMLPDSEWLVVVRIEAGTSVTITDRAGNRTTAERATALWEICEIRPVQ